MIPHSKAYVISFSNIQSEFRSTHAISVFANLKEKNWILIPWLILYESYIKIILIAIRSEFYKKNDENQRNKPVLMFVCIEEPMTHQALWMCFETECSLFFLVRKIRDWNWKFTYISMFLNSCGDYNNFDILLIQYKSRN